MRQLERRAGQGAAQGGHRARRGATRRRSRSTAADLARLPGPAAVHPGVGASVRRCPGVATGLAVTGAGGDVLFIEATAMAGEAGLTLTGQLGDVMKESAQIALSYLRGAAARSSASTGRRLERAPVHVHVPAGAVPKDGPSAGVTMVDRAGVAADRAAGALRGRHDRRGHADRAGAADRRGEAEAARRPPGRADRGVHPEAQRAGPGRRPGRGARGADRAPGPDVADVVAGALEHVAPPAGVVAA